MSKIYRKPKFPSVCRVMRGLLGGPWTIVYDGECEKVVRAGAFGLFGLDFFAGEDLPFVMIYFPAGTDVRGENSSTGFDWVLWQRNPGWVYRIRWTENIAAGFANEFRACWCTQELQTPTPQPMG